MIATHRKPRLKAMRNNPLAEKLRAKQARSIVQMEPKKVSK